MRVEAGAVHTQVERQALQQAAAVQVVIPIPFTTALLQPQTLAEVVVALELLEQQQLVLVVLVEKV
tara:strand:- start:308 stop:505 length:198 start_codon:yes stop_codon:yes gene_type:complete